MMGPLTNSTAGNTTNVLANSGGTLRLRDELDSIFVGSGIQGRISVACFARWRGHSLVPGATFLR